MLGSYRHPKVVRSKLTSANINIFLFGVNNKSSALGLELKLELWRYELNLTERKESTFFFGNVFA